MQLQDTLISRRTQIREARGALWHLCLIALLGLSGGGCSKKSMDVHRGDDLVGADRDASQASIDSGLSGEGFKLPDASKGDASLVDATLADASDKVDPLDKGGCGSIELEPMVNTEVAPGNLLVVFDNSGSMGAAWGNTTRWLAAANALRDAVSSLSEYLTVGAIIFPTDASCGVAEMDSGQQIRFLSGATFVATWDNFAQQNTPIGGTPLGLALAVADRALMAAALTGITNVIVLTDGEPGCDSSSLTGPPANWLLNGIKTHVVGLPGSESAVTTLDSIAMAGGTDQHLTPDDPRTLRHSLATIISQTVISALPSCTIPLDPPVENPDDVHVIITQAGKQSDAPRDLGDSGGWTVAKDGSSIELFGAFCDQGLAGAYDRISIELGCVTLPPLEPPPLQ